MKFFSEKQLISAVISLSLFNNVAAGVFEDALNSIANSFNGQNPNAGNSAPNKVMLADGPPDEQASGEDFSALFGKGGLEALGLPQEAIDRAAAAAQNGEEVDANAYNVSTTTNPYVPATTTTSPAVQTSSTTTTTSQAEPSSSTTTTTSSAEQPSTTTTTSPAEPSSTTTSPAVQTSSTTTTTSQAEQSSTTTTTTSSAGQSSTTTVAPTSVKPYTSSTTTTSSTNPSPSSTTSGTYPGPTGNPTPGPNKGIIGVVFDLIKSVVVFLWSYRTPIWNFAYSYIIKPIFDWISNKFSGGGSAYAT